MRMALTLCFTMFLITSVLAQPQPQDNQTVTVGPWTIATTFKGDRFDSCTMDRSSGELGINFVRKQDGMMLNLNSSKWRLDRGKAYTIRLVAGSRSVETKALAETKDVAVALVDRALNERLRTANVLEVQGEGATLRLPLDGSAAAFARLEECFDKNSREGVEANPFVAPNRKP